VAKHYGGAVAIYPAQLQQAARSAAVAAGVHVISPLAPDGNGSTFGEVALRPSRRCLTGSPTPPDPDR
jgi:hypothetical protein